MQKGSLKVVKNRRGEKVWRAQWRENGTGRTRILGRYADIDRASARAEFDKILAPLRAVESSSRTAPVSLGEYIEREYLVSRNCVWKDSTRSTTEQLIGTHIIAEMGSVALVSVTRRRLQDLLDQKAAAGLSVRLFPISAGSSRLFSRWQKATGW